MADVTWTAAVNTDFTNVGNWTGGVPAADGDTIDSTTATAPATNRPTGAGETYHFSITNAVTVTISNFLNGAAIGNVTVDNAGAAVYCGGAITGNVVVTNGLFYPSNFTISGTTDIAAAGSLTLYGAVITAVGEVTLAGTLRLNGGASDCSVPLRVTASTAAVDWGTTGEILGGFNAAGYTVAHTNTTSADLVCDVAGTLDLGGTATGVPINVTAATTASGTWTAGTVTATAGAITLADGANITANFVGAGGTVALAANATATITGNVTQGAVAARLVTVAAGQNLTVTGTTTGGSVGAADGAWVNGGTATFNAVVGGSNGNARGIKVAGGTVTITSATGGTGFGVWITGGTATVGTATPGANRSIYFYSGTCTVGRFTNSSVVQVGPASGAGGATVILGAGPHSIASIAEGHADNVGNALTIGGTASAAGTVNLTGIACTVSSGATMSSGGLTTGTGSTLAGNTNTWTVGNTGATIGGGTISGTLTLDLSDGTGAFTVTALAVAPAAVLTVNCGTGGASYNASAALTISGVLYMVMEANATLTWIDTISAIPAHVTCINRLTINPGVTVTQGGKVAFGRLVGGATATFTGNGDSAYWRPQTAADDWDFTGTANGTGNFVILAAADALVLTGTVSVTGRPVYCYSVGYSVTIGGLVCDEALTVYNAIAGTTTLTIAGNSSGTAIALGGAGTANQLGALVLGSGYVHRFTGAIARAGTGTNVFKPQGRCIFTGTFTGTGIVVTPTYEGAIDCGGFGRVTAVTSTGRRLIVRSAVHSTTGIPLRGWQDDSCVNVMFKGRKVIGEPGVN